MRQHSADHPVDLLLDQVEDLLVGDGEHEEQLAPGEVVDDVHHLQDRAGAELAVAAAGGEREQPRHVEPGDRLRDRKVEVAPQVVDRFGLYLLHALLIGGVVGIELLRADEVDGLVASVEVEPVPVDDRAAAKHQPNGFQIPKAELLEGSVEAVGLGPVLHSARDHCTPGRGPMPNGFGEGDASARCAGRRASDRVPT